MTDWFIEFRGQQIARLSDGFVPDQFWVHFRLEVIGNSLGINAQTLASHDWWNAHFEEVLYCSSDGSLTVSGEYVIPSPQSASELALRGIGFTLSQPEKTLIERLRKALGERFHRSSLEPARGEIR